MVRLGFDLDQGGAVLGVDTNYHRGGTGAVKLAGTRS